ncbi:MAG: protein translocase subunit SecDF, partial [Chitinophagaceae bacterium]|nr:protein translocase subunit SecDF [Chitinophagaceae bacterium]
MQFKGLVRFFAILLIIYSLYQLSFTWFVKNHEKKMEAKAFTYVKANHADAKKFTRADDLPDSLKTIYDSELRRLLASTKDETLTYGITGPVSYQKAKEEELNLGLDLQGGMNVTMEVEMTGLLKTLANNSKDPSFLAALSNAEKQKANSDADFVTLFTTEYKKLAGEGKMSALFFAANSKDIKIGDSDDKVASVLRTNAKGAFDNTFRVLNTRIDQFGVAQPSINPNPERGIITVELPGIKDKERVRKLLQATANLQFWETYRFDELQPALVKTIQDYDRIHKGTTGDTAAAKIDTAATTPKVIDTTRTLSEELGTDKPDSPAVAATVNTNTGGDKRSFAEIMKPIGGNASFIGTVAVNDTAYVRETLTSELIFANFPNDARFAYGIPDLKNKNEIPLYVLRTYN